MGLEDDGEGMAMKERWTASGGRTRVAAAGRMGCAVTPS